MKLTYTKATKRSPKNKWQLNLRYEHGDADASTYHLYNYDSEEEFVKAIETLKNLFEFKNKWHNMFCDFKRGNDFKKEIAKMRQDLAQKVKYIKDFNQQWDLEHIEAYERFLELVAPHTNIFNYIEALGFETESDVTHGGDYYQIPYAIEEAFYFDKNGDKSIVTWK